MAIWFIKKQITYRKTIIEIDEFQRRINKK